MRQIPIILIAIVFVLGCAKTVMSDIDIYAWEDRALKEKELGKPPFKTGTACKQDCLTHCLYKTVEVGYKRSLFLYTMKESKKDEVMEFLKFSIQQKITLRNNCKRKCLYYCDGVIK